ncbi:MULTISPECIES: hypothetical protein [unclassified Bradyrhizobium]|uniref:hypothetical protein n=1 Tax=unclassified Bradyrhizobium TaxID=2631580 RepID=UPI001BA52FB6|nr:MULTISPECIES: hypothetical protein [unclassified Bradyrhizobium]MBR1224916.1 hypothetical protein [Bradyrhizobium sp. AUGA SZCCT0176]MBR1232983.1 hypothetical protein [Bradyrhizobium sp. AUGA SZCCT0182]MBR1301374.1 hypothetical protein [Bradyrhizobium sp. AUGA SZCCT0042]
MVDQHQVQSIIADAICECFKDHPERSIGFEEAKQMAKCVVEALANARLEICVSEQD